MALKFQGFCEELINSGRAAGAPADLIGGLEQFADRVLLLCNGSVHEHACYIRACQAKTAMIKMVRSRFTGLEEEVGWFMAMYMVFHSHIYE